MPACRVLFKDRGVAGLSAQAVLIDAFEGATFEGQHSKGTIRRAPFDGQNKTVL